MSPFLIRILVNSQNMHNSFHMSTALPRSRCVLFWSLRVIMLYVAWCSGESARARRSRLWRCFNFLFSSGSPACGGWIIFCHFGELGSFGCAEDGVEAYHGYGCGYLIGFPKLPSLLVFRPFLQVACLTGL